jgi:uncharacterized protein YecE (DUF72 family)
MPAELLDLTIPKRLQPRLKVGTCSWKYDSWKGLIYEEGKAYKAQDYLADYARRLGSVEIDQWFWSLFPAGIRLPEPRDVRRYAEAVPDDFVFTVKAPNALTLTHFYAKLDGPDKPFAGKPNASFLKVDLLERFLDRLAPFGGKLGPIMFQFEYLNKQKMAGREAFLEAFGSFLDKAPKGFSYALETRNPNYIGPELFDFLQSRSVGFVYLEGYYMPPIGSIFEDCRPKPAPFSVIRLHGGDRGEIEKATGEVRNKIVEPKPEGLKAAAAITAENIRAKITTYLNVNNHFEGSAPLTIGRFLEGLAAALPSRAKAPAPRTAE